MFLSLTFAGTTALQACPCADPSCGPAADYPLLARLRDGQADGNSPVGAVSPRVADRRSYDAPTYEQGDEEGDAAGGVGPRLERFSGDGGFTDPEQRGRFGRAEIPAFQGAFAAPSSGGGFSGGGSGSDEDEDSDAELDAMMNDLEAEGGALAR